MGRIVIPVMDEEPFPILSAIRSMLSKYGFTEKKTESSEKILLDFYEEERKFDEFSQKALRIRNKVVVSFAAPFCVSYGVFSKCM